MKKLSKNSANVLPFKNTCPCTILLPPFFNFSDSSSPRKLLEIYFLSLRKSGGGGGGFWTMYEPFISKREMKKGHFSMTGNYLRQQKVFRFWGHLNEHLILNRSLKNTWNTPKWHFLWELFIIYPWNIKPNWNKNKSNKCFPRVFSTIRKFI